MKKLQDLARPLAMYAMIFAFMAITIVVLILLMAGTTQLADASAILVTIIGVIAPIMTAMVAGRSWEKVRGVVNQPDTPPATPVDMLMEDTYDTSDDDDLFADVRRMNLDEYRSRRPNDLAVD